MNPSVTQPFAPGFSKRQECGAVIVESALTIGVLFFLLFAILEFGRAYNIYQTLTDAAREGARYSVAPDPANSYTAPSSSQIQANVQQFMAAANVRGSTVNVSCVYAAGSPAPQTSFCPPGAAQNTDSTLQIDNGFNPVYTEVKVSVPYKFLVLPFSVTMSSKAVMRNENN
jgi:Flp pilus assembly protein TadG